MEKSKMFKIKVWGENACFTRPEMKVERVSYDVMTPSAARGILEAILWKPAISWKIDRIDILKEIRWQSVRRNEVGSKIPLNNVTSAMNKGSGALAIFIEDDRQQRAGLFLKDVAYVIHAHFVFTEKKGPSDNRAKFEEMFERRLKKGQCHHFPVLGNREFPAYFEPATGDETPCKELSKDLGYMLYDLEFGEKQSDAEDYENVRPLFFRAEVKHGVLKIPDRSGPEVVG